MRTQSIKNQKHAKTAKSVNDALYRKIPAVDASTTFSLFAFSRNDGEGAEPLASQPSRAQKRKINGDMEFPMGSCQQKITKLTVSHLIIIKFHFALTPSECRRHSMLCSTVSSLCVPSRPPSSPRNHHDENLARKCLAGRLRPSMGAIIMSLANLAMQLGIGGDPG